MSRHARWSARTAGLFLLGCALAQALWTVYLIRDHAYAWKYFAAAAAAGGVFSVWWFARDFRDRCAGRERLQSRWRPTLPLWGVVGAAEIVNNLDYSVQAAAGGFVVSVVLVAAVYVLAVVVPRGWGRS